MEQFGGGKKLVKKPSATKNNSPSARRRYMKYLNKPSDTKISGDKKKINVNPPKNQRKKRKNVNESREKALTRTTLRMLQGAPSQQKKAPPSPSPAPPPAPAPTRSTAPAPAPAPPPPAPSPAPTPAPAPAPSKKKLKRSKKSTKRHTKRNNSRQVKVSKPTVLTDEHIKRVEKKIQNIRKQKLSDMKKELEKRGVKTTGKSNRLLKDIYLYSKMSNINFQHEK